MKNLRKNPKKNSQTGVALLVAMIALLLITGVALAMIVASGSEGALNGNYRSSSSAYYAALAGLEEARGRLLSSHPNAITVVNPVTGFMAVNTVQYIVNPNVAAGEAAGTILATYPDNEYASEFGVAGVPLPNITSVSGTNASNIPGPMFKWVRINPITEKSLGNVDVNGDGNIDAITPLYYDSTPATLIVPPAALGVPNPPSTANQVFEITSLAVLPNGSQRMAQYLVSAKTYDLTFPSALTLAGTVGTFAGATSNPYHMNGVDGSGNPPAVPGCINNHATVDAIGVSAASDATTVTNGIPNNRLDHYTGTQSAPDVAVATITSALATPATLDPLLAEIKNNADVVMQPNPPPGQNYNNSGTTYNFGASGTGYTWPSDMSASNPKTIYVDGSFDLGPNTGYGLLIVTGNFHYQGNSGWKGIILVIGDGTTTFDGNGGGNGEFDGAVFVATTRDASGNQLANFGVSNYDISGGGGNGVYFNSCWIKQAKKPPTWMILSFKEIQYTD